jgi:hypothetical protein
MSHAKEGRMSFYADPLFIKAEVAWRQESLGRANQTGTARRGPANHRRLWLVIPHRPAVRRRRARATRTA